MKRLKSKNQWICLFAVLFISTLFKFLPAQAFQHGPVHIQTIDYPPLMGEKDCFLNDIARESFLRSGLSVEFEIIPLARINWSVKNNKAPVYLGTARWLTQPDSREKLSIVPIGYTTFHFFYLKTRFPKGLTYEKLPDLGIYKIGSLRGSMFEELFSNAGIKPDLVSNLELNIRKLIAGRIDLYLASRQTGFSIMEKIYPHQFNNLRIIEKPIKGVYAHIMFQKNQSLLKTNFKQGFKKIREDGTYLKIYSRYWNISYIPEKGLNYIRYGFPGE